MLAHQQQDGLRPPNPQTAPEKKPIVFKHNVVVQVADTPGGGRFIEAGEPSPYHDIDEVPVNLRPFIVTDDEPEPDEESNIRFELGVVYQMMSDGRRGRALNRQVAQMEAEAERQAWAEDVLDMPLRADIADAVEDQNAASIGRQMAEMETRARWLDSANEAAEQGGE